MVLSAEFLNPVVDGLYGTPNLTKIRHNIHALEENVLANVRGNVPANVFINVLTIYMH